MKLFCLASGVPDETRRGVIPPRDSTTGPDAGIAPWLHTMEHRYPVIIAPDTCPTLAQSSSGQQIVIEPELRDRDHGTWHGSNLRDLAPEALHRWIHDPQFAPPGGESGQAMFDRIGRWLGNLSGDTSHRILVARPAVIKLLLIHALGGGPGMVGHLDVPPSSRSDMSCHGGWRVSAIGVPLG